MGIPKISVGLASCGIASGAQQIYDKLQEIIRADQLVVHLKKTGCIGMCYNEPLVEIRDDTGSYLYGGVDEQRIVEIMDRHIGHEEPVREYLVSSDMFEAVDDSFWKGQVNIALRNCGIIDPEDISEYERREGYQALRRILEEGLSQEQVIQVISDSGLRGRGGGGFPSGLKWNFAYKNPAAGKYIICNADEGDPGAFMDRSLLEGDPHSVIEGLIIGAYCTGASKGFVYCRAEYPLAIKRLNIALEQAKMKGYLGDNIMGREDFHFGLSLKEGAGAFVCGEETALIASIEGRRGMPDKRPPYPAESGLWDQPTNINNVETYANVPQIILKGADYFNQYGTEKSKGTKVFALTGKINRGGSVEVPMGMTVNDIVYKLGGGIPDGRKFKAIQLGGPSGGCIPAYLGDTIIDYDSVNATGAIMGSGGMVVMDETTCMVDVAKFFLEFTRKESCGKCTFCRIGTKRMLEILSRIAEGEGEETDLERLEELAYQIKSSSLCGLGQTAPNPVLTTIKYFRDEYEAHIVEKKCPTKRCKGLVKYAIDPEKCTGCVVCARNCPVNAISGEKKEVHVIDQERCIKCGVCYNKCRFDAVILL